MFGPKGFFDTFLRDEYDAALLTKDFGNSRIAAHAKINFHCTAPRVTYRQKGDIVVGVAILSHPGGDNILRFDVSDEELEAAAEETALSYTVQTSAQQPCCQ